MNEPGKHHTKGKKHTTKDHVLYDSFYKKCPEQANAQRMPQDGKVEANGVIPNGYNLLLA